MATEAEKKAKNKYAKEKCTLIPIRFYPTDKDIIEHLKLHKPTATYIKGLIRADMKNKD